MYQIFMDAKPYPSYILKKNNKNNHQKIGINSYTDLVFVVVFVFFLFFYFLGG